MFDKLKELFDKTPEREFKPRQQGLRSTRTVPAPAEIDSDTEDCYESDDTLHGKSVLIGHDPFNGKQDQGQAERIQSKIDLIKQLQKELQGR